MHRKGNKRKGIGLKHSRSPNSDTDDRQSCQVKARSYKNRCPTPTCIGATPPIENLKQIQKVKQRNTIYQNIIPWDPSIYMNIMIP